MAESTTVDISTEEAVIVSPPLQPHGEVQFIKLSVPRNRYCRFRKSWLDIYTPVYNQMKIDLSIDYKSGVLELKSRHDTPPRVITDNLQKSSNFVVAFMVGFEINDAITLLGKPEEDMDEDEDEVKMYFESIETKDAEIRRREHLSQALKRLVKAKSGIEWASRTKIVVEGTMVHIIGRGCCYANVEIAKSSVYGLLLCKPTKLSRISNREEHQVSSSIKYWIN